MTGIGGSALLAPLLILVLGVKPSVAVGTDLVYSVPAKLLAAFAHLRQKTVDLRVAGALALGGVAGSVLGLIAFRLVRERTPAAAFQLGVRHAIGGVILAAVAAGIVANVLPSREAPRRDGRLVAVAIGVFVGFLVALTSIGSGSVTLPLLMLALPGVALRNLIGAEIAFAAVIIPVSAAGHAAFSDVDWRLALSLALGAVPGSYLGALLCARVGERPLRLGVIAVLAYAGITLL